MRCLSALLLLSLLSAAMSSVVNRFTECQEFFVEGKPPAISGVLTEGNVQDQNRYKLICQRFDNSYRFATLYDTANRIPVFSAYMFTGVNTTMKRTNVTWMIEPQLDGGNNNEMALASKTVNYTHQAVNEDYKGSINKSGVNKGHVFPRMHAYNIASQKSTFTLTNCVPQMKSSNCGSWLRMECKVKKYLTQNCINDMSIKAYVVTGAVPSNNNTLNNRVNIPSYLWTAFCCFHGNLSKWVSAAHGSFNVDETRNKTLPWMNLRQLNAKLNQSYHGDVLVFPSQCPDDFNITDDSNFKAASCDNDDEQCAPTPNAAWRFKMLHILPVLGYSVVVMMWSTP